MNTPEEWVKEWYENKITVQKLIELVQKEAYNQAIDDIKESILKLKKL